MRTPFSQSRSRLAIALAILAISLATGLPTDAGAQDNSSPIVTRDVKREFPRLGGIQIGRNPYNNDHNHPEYRAKIAKLDVAILSRWASDRTAEEIKKLNPEILLGKYTNITEIYHRAPDEHNDWRNKLSAEVGPDSQKAPDWWLYTPTGEKIENWPGTFKVNISEYVQPDANGDRWVDYRAKYDYNKWFRNPVWDIWYSDVVNFQPRLQGTPYSYSGGKVSGGEERAAYRRAHRKHWDNIYNIRPGTMITANINWWNYQQNRGVWDLDIYDQRVQSAVFEHAMARESYSYYSNLGWKATYDWYRWGLSYLAKPEVLIFHVVGDPQDYQWVRYTFASCLMADGFYKFSPKDFNFGTVEWFDEFDLAGTADTSWLGLAMEGAPDAPWQKGVWRRDFENGVALVNPERNGAQTVTIENGFRRIAGNQDSTVNNGQVAGTIRLEAGDGIILIRDTAAQAPSPPAAPVLRLGS